MTGAPRPTTSPDAPESVVLAVSVCVFRDDMVLMVERAKDPGGGLWAPVGGHVEPGESLEAAALRETLEETGVACHILGVSSERDIAVPATQTGAAKLIRLVVHAARWLSGEPKAASDAARARFVSLEDLPTLALVDGVLPHIAAARRLYDGFES